MLTTSPRFLVCLSLDMVEAEGDAEGWMTVRRLMVSYFLAHNLNKQDQKYAMFTMFDLVVEQSASPRTQARMKYYMSINVSGTRGGGLFMDKWCEHCVRKVKTCLRSCHGKIDDLLLEKMLSGLAVVSSICEHHREPVMREKVGKEGSHDFVGDSVKHILEEQVDKADPFNREREVQHQFHDKPRSSPYTGMMESYLQRFVDRMQTIHNQKY